MIDYRYFYCLQIITSVFTYLVIATILGVWRAGGYFLPVDAFLQEKLIQLKKNSSRYLALITNVDTDALNSAASNWDVLKARELLQGNYQFKAVPYLKSINPFFPAYVGMTSGSKKLCL